VAPEVQEPARVVDLMEALKAQPRFRQPGEEEAGEGGLAESCGQVVEGHGQRRPQAQGLIAGC
jgi:hypothetical protein